MKKCLLIGIFLYSIFTLQAQEVFLNGGKNFTAYDFKANTLENVDLKNGNGFNYELGYNSANKSNNPFFFSVSAVINEYNASGSTSGRAIEWKTNYLGAKGAIYCTILQNTYNNLAFKVGLGVESIVYGRQKINYDQMDLVGQKEFSGIFTGPGVGLLYSFEINVDFALQIAYNYDKRFNISNQSQEKLNFNNHSLNVGFSVKID